MVAGSTRPACTAVIIRAAATLTVKSKVARSRGDGEPDLIAGHWVASRAAS